ncbi:hypothetical protein AB6A40_002293 [Gnathostoma spinigerum]|uniref:C2HC/C3H-type domain-containing protein n=1 Tax=Gnathostoma spinigerum TaxID=75299 RepID=A0ABD6E680_9BILA
MSSLAKELIRCQYCGRNFNETAAERHIPHCHEQSLRKARGTSTTRSTSNQRRTQKSKSPSGRNQGRAEEEKGLISKTADLFINDSLRSFPSNKTSHEKLSGQHHLNQSNRSTPPIHRTMANDTETVTKISRTSAVRKRSTSIPKKAKAQHHKG